MSRRPPEGVTKRPGAGYAGAPERVRLSVWPLQSGSATMLVMTSTVLVVDDHPSFRTTARRLLQAEGFDVVGEAENGAEALRKAGELHPELVLLDVQLPDLNGFEVAQVLCRNGRSPAIVLVSSRDADDYGDLISSCGARGFIAKAELSGASIRALLA